jgi:hypothetical protein
VPPSNAGGTVVIPTIDELYQRTQILTTITPKFRLFLIASGIIYITWGLAIIGLEIAIALQSQLTNYRSIWPSVFILCAGINMSVVGCRINYPMNNLIRIFYIVLLFCFVGLILLAINNSTSDKCPHYSSCDNSEVATSKLSSLILTIFATVHTVINIVVIRKEDKKSMAASTT